MTVVKLEMEPQNGEIDLSKTAILMIDMQRDFLEPKGFGESLGNDVSKLQRAVEPCRRVLEATREYNQQQHANDNNKKNKKILIIHTREGHRPDMTDVHPYKLDKFGTTKPYIGEVGPMGRILIQGQPGHDIIPQLYPRQGEEPIVDKPGKGSFYGTNLQTMLQAQQIQTLIVCGVTSEVCVHTTIREGNDRGYHCIALEDACASYNDEFHNVAMRMISAQGGIFGSVSTSEKFLQALQQHSSSPSSTTK